MDVRAGALTIESEQDASNFAAHDRSTGVSLSYGVGTGAVSGSGRGRQEGDFASVIEQSGIYAGTGGYDIGVDGHIALTGAVIASQAEAERNRLVTGTLSASDIANREEYSASQSSLGVGLGGIMLGRGGDTSTQSNSGPKLPGLSTPLGNLTASPPVTMGAQGDQDGITHSAIAPGVIEITSGDTASQLAASTISRDIAAANSGSIAQQFDAQPAPKSPKALRQRGSLAHRPAPSLPIAPRTARDGMPNIPRPEEKETPMPSGAQAVLAISC